MPLGAWTQWMRGTAARGKAKPSAQSGARSWRPLRAMGGPGGGGSSARGGGGRPAAIAARSAATAASRDASQRRARASYSAHVRSSRRGAKTKCVESSRKSACERDACAAASSAAPGGGSAGGG
jgi:hypothetical protein